MVESMIPQGYVVSEPPMPYADTLWGTAADGYASPREALQQLPEQIGPISHMRQVHGNRVATALQTRTYEEYDALVTPRTDLWLAVKTADCLPVLVSSPGAVAAIHAGWRGLAADVISAAIHTLWQSFGEEPHRTFVQVGPFIQQANYEVAADVADHFPAAASKPFGDNGQRLLDMGWVARQQCREAGVPGQNVQVSGTCVYQSADYHSHRRYTHTGQPSVGRQLSLIRRRKE